MKPFKKSAGFTLLEMMLVLVIMASIIVMVIGFATQKTDEIRRDRAVMQMQMIQNAALAFYVNNSYWPVNSDHLCNSTGDLSILQAQSYLPSGNSNNPWGKPYSIGCNITAGTFTVYSIIPSDAEGMYVAGRFPFGQVNGATKVVSASVTIPGQNLNNARSVNFASIYRSGACVPAPTCPTNMKPSIMVVPVSVSGVNDTPTGCTGTGKTDDLTGCTANIYPISSFTAFAKGKGTTSDPDDPSTLQDCSTGLAFDCKSSYSGLPTDEPAGTKYWRACLTVVTEKGIVPSSDYPQGKMKGAILAITRCVPNNGSETPRGTDFSIFAPNQNWAP